MYTYGQYFFIISHKFENVCFWPLLYENEAHQINLNKLIFENLFFICEKSAIRLFEAGISS
jgi:hypothetical protein